MEWRNGAPFNPQFDDVYFNTEGGIEESDYVFIQGNDLPRRFSALERGSFNVLETGFGTGLNFLGCAHQFLANNQCAHLNFISIEAFPLTRDELAAAHQSLEHYQREAKWLQQAWPSACDDTQTMIIHPRITLTVIFMPVEQALEQLIVCAQPQTQAWVQPCFDAIMLDGFSPAKNPDMWSKEVMQQLAVLSHSNTTLATFSCARMVRDHLQSAGFSLSKRRGINSKREVLAAKAGEKLAQPISPATTRSSQHEAPWWSFPSQPLPQRVAVIGAGLAGCQTAARLAARGIAVSLFDRHAAPAQAASGNPQGVLYTKFSHRKEPLSDLALQCYQFAQHYYRHQLDISAPWSGVLQLPKNDKDATLQRLVGQRFIQQPELVQLVDQAEASKLSGMTIRSNALWFPQGTWMTPPEVCRQLIANQRLITTHFNTTVAQLDFCSDRQQWALQSQPTLDSPHFDQVVLCTAYDAHALLDPLLPLKTRTIRGQIDRVQGDIVRQLRTTLTGEGYIAADGDGTATIGASFVVDDLDPAHRLEESAHNRHLVAQLSPQLQAEHANLTQLDARVAFRCASADYLPIAGPVPQYREMVETFAPLRKNRRMDIRNYGHYQPGLWLNIAHGSKGLNSTPMVAEMISSMICNAPSPLSQRLQRAIHPARFLMRDIFRGVSL
ncbi:bifunctional tRNA (5-methylaminomethyl-2-thiouridine)(34)-methyltransferase MnmD/FAD-dependent 5-carboxymethylaminomethyl-2-thiouridine(34) oxidoreductase MnmC [Umboniibacter marinipuniceus]|uniref:tRNA 5-methylaminomethyl-2-thiouridine biosynthesis bifunctional protein MnmC n=1 Tax=Umboniibacter marinipuniceus TaxID=569599 RepID=A0A3M0AFV2_9GAMM|nr:bifunctional tRNA (5-methylaminomethyl-2-thiouridine)(34)-methyltransferase MnmD/FAD-dependent 5-carboxymethylaminomethyl-2-thiouridine(34) oxidoreductase MnmC [Umboniibacter marinipuniceus]RMA81375.1 tRNA 5-methylaminomethyl-2-thiouridine biosynthesis bifunctional protein [Umboniibacter marinipuniceus]